MGGIIAGVAAVVSVLASFTNLLQQIYPGWNGDWATLQGMTPNTTNLDTSTIFPLVAGILAVLVIVWIFAIIAAFFIWRSSKTGLQQIKRGLIWNCWVDLADRRNNSGLRVDSDVDFGTTPGNCFFHNEGS